MSAAPAALTVPANRSSRRRTAIAARALTANRLPAPTGAADHPTKTLDPPQTTLDDQSRLEVPGLCFNIFRDGTVTEAELTALAQVH
jgi:hypothetical protein